MKLLALLTALMLTLPARASAPAFDPLAFFEGPTRGVGVLTVRGRSRGEPFTVAGLGVREPSGALRLAQAITWDDGRVERRTWRMWSLQPGAWGVSGTDMVGQGRAQVVGNAVVLRWRRRGGPLNRPLAVTQTLRLRPDGAVDNAGPFRLFGVTVARLEERIERVDGR